MIVPDPGQPVAGQCWSQRSREAWGLGGGIRGSEVSLGSVSDPSIAQLPPLRTRSVERGAWWPSVPEKRFKEKSAKERKA